MSGTKANCIESVRCSGMTLVEVLVFSSLALMVLGGSFPLLSRLMASDKAHEERLAAFMFLQNSAEQLSVVPFESLTNGFEEVVGNNGSRYKKVIASTNFYKTISAKYRVQLLPKTSSQTGDYYLALFELRWSTKIGGLPKQKHSTQISKVFVPDV
jgi:type II secretory pathway pseudopilin PulG